MPLTTNIPILPSSLTDYTKTPEKPSCKFYFKYTKYLYIEEKIEVYKEIEMIYNKKE